MHQQNPGRDARSLLQVRGIIMLPIFVLKRPVWTTLPLWLIVVALLSACDAKTANDSESQCAPSCGAACGVDDGCGGECPCEGDDTAPCKGSSCEDKSCGACKLNEACMDGRCQCVPACESNACGDDGCGGRCACPDGFVTDAEGNVVPREDCRDSCASAGFVCGEVCGERCGACADGGACNDGKCACKPHCDGTSCSDGCGGSCE